MEREAKKMTESQGWKRKSKREPKRAKKEQRIENIIFSQEKYSNGETSLQFFQEYLIPEALYLLDEPEVSLSPANQVALAHEINKLAHYLGCQFVIATHSPFMLGTLDAKIYNLDAKEWQVTPWYQLENVRYFYDFFKKHEKEFTQWALFFFHILTNLIMYYTVLVY